MLGSVSFGFRCVLGVEALGTYTHLLDDLGPVLEIHLGPARAVGGEVGEVALVEVTPVVAGDLEVFADPAV